MSIFSRLAIGTAAWGKEYNGKIVSESEQKDILDYCQCSGIDMLDTAVAYDCQETIGRLANSYFHIVSKGDREGFEHTVKQLQRKPYAYLTHSSSIIWTPFYEGLSYKTDKLGLSIYDPSDIPAFGTFGVHQVQVIQVPYSLYDRRFESYLPALKERGIEIHVRSIFLQGKILEKASPQDCISFCLMNPYVDRVIIGVDSFEQLKDNLRFLHRMNSLEVHNEQILDPRRWKEKK